MLYRDRKGSWRPLVLCVDPTNTEADRLRLLFSLLAVDHLGNGPAGPGWWIQASRDEPLRIEPIPPGHGSGAPTRLCGNGWKVETSSFELERVRSSFYCRVVGVSAMAVAGVRLDAISAICCSANRVHRGSRSATPSIW